MLTTVLVNYNHARFLRESLGSVLKQTRPSDELIVIDDTSTDNSVEVIQSFLPRHPNARLIQNPKNQGCFANCNDGLRLARGDYVHFAAADDVFYPRHYEVGVGLLENNSAAVFSSRSDIINEVGQNQNSPIPWLGYPREAPGYIDAIEAQNCLMRDDGWFMGNTALFRRGVLVEEGGFPLDLQSFADGYVCRFLALKYGACFSPEVLAAWRRLDAGFAGSVLRSPEKAAALIAAAERRMLAAKAVFPIAYVKRWKGREEFQVRRQALARARAQNSERGVVGRVAGALIEKFSAAVLLLKLRPWDLAGNIRQRFTPNRERP